MVQWLGTIDGLSDYSGLKINEVPNFAESQLLGAMADGVNIFEALEVMDNNYFDKMEISYDNDDAFKAYRNYHAVLQGLKKFYKNLHGYSRNDV